MAPSQLTQLKAKIQARRAGKSIPGPQAQSSRKSGAPGHNAGQKKQPRPKSIGEEQRKATLLKELQSRHKVGGIIDRRIGENDPSMAPEDRMLQRYARQRSKRDTMFNLEDAEGGSEDEEALLTHGGRAISGLAADDMRDDFDADGEGLQDDDEDDLFTRPAKKRRLSEEIAELEARNAAAEGEPERRKSKKEVMEEVIAKSKLYKYERQAAKEDDEAIRATLDKEMPDLMALLRGVPVKAPQAVQKQAPAKTSDAAIHPDRLAFMDSDEAKAKQAEKEYDKRLRQLAMDTRAQPTERTKTEEEKAASDAARLKELEEKRLRRMKGEEEDSDEAEPARPDVDEVDAEDDEEDADNEAVEFGLPDAPTSRKAVLDVEDEDDFVIDEDLVASGSDIDEDFDVDSDEEEEQIPDDDSEFLAGVLPEDEAHAAEAGDKTKTGSRLAYTYPCPQSHSQFLDVLKDIADVDMPVVIQRIRALYHPQLNAQNKEKLSRFAIVLVDHIAYMGSRGLALNIVETVIRHVHSLSRTYPETIGGAFRAHLVGMQERGTLQPGDLFILTAIGSTYPTSDHFHQVVTPAITIMARWLEMTTPRTPQDMATGAYVVALTLSYQALSKRYIPEAVRFTLAALGQPQLSDTLLTPHLANLTRMLDLYRDLPSFYEVFFPFQLVLKQSLAHSRVAASTSQKLKIALSASILARRPLTLHHHRPLPIKSSIPKFEDSFDPTKHYDPDRERAEASKLRAEYKRERKGALRELKKDASFLAREGLKRKRETDDAYKAKERRLIAEIQGEEGREAKEYEREKRKRKGQR